MTTDRHRVLIIDDDANTRTLLKLLFESNGLDVDLAPDGETGLALVAAAHPDVILLDVAMPRRSGHDVYRDLQYDPATAAIPIIILSAALTTREQAKWEELPHIADVLIKPFDIYGLLGRIRELLH